MTVVFAHSVASPVHSLAPWREASSRWLRIPRLSYLDHLFESTAVGTDH